MSRWNYMKNGQQIPLTVKVEDTLPVGTEVDYDGSTIPEGWVEVDNILWENPNPNSNMANNTLINLKSSDYDILEIYYKYTTSNNNLWSKRILKGYDAYLDIAIPYYTTSNFVANEYRNFVRQSDTQYKISHCNITHTDNTSLTREDFIIPVKIIGYKL